MYFFIFISRLNLCEVIEKYILVSVPSSWYRAPKALVISEVLGTFFYSLTLVPDTEVLNPLGFPR